MATPISKVTLTIDNKDYIYGLKQAESATKDFANEAERSFSRADQASNKLNLASQALIRGFGGLRSSLLGLGLGAFAVNALQSADAVADLADSTQMSIGKILEFQKALKLAGGDAEDTGKALATFYASIEEANAGSDKIQETFRRLGISLKDLRTLSEEDLLDKTIKGFNNLSDPVQRNTTLTELFGKSMRTVDPARLATELENLRGTLAAQEGSTMAAADAIEQFESLIGSLKGAVVLALKPFLEFAGLMKDQKIDVAALAGAIQNLVAGYVALRVAAMGAAVAQAALGKGIRGGVAGVAVGVAAAAATYKGLQELMDQIGAGPQPGQQGPGAALGPDASMEAILAEERRIRERRNRDTEERNRQQQLGKELQSQLNAVNNLTDGYLRAGRANMDRYRLEVDLLGKTQEETDLAKGKADIEKRYADQIAALEEKRKGAKGETLSLINKSITKIQEMRDSELGVYEATKLQTQEYARQQDLIKRTAELGRTLTGIQDQVTAAQFQGAQATQNPLQRQFKQIQEDARVAAQNATRTYIQSFGDDPSKLTADQVTLMNTGVKAIEEAYRQLAEQQTKNLEYSRTWEAGWNEAFNAYVDNATNAAQRARDQFNAITSNMNSAIDKFVETGKFSFKDFTNSVLKDLVKIEMKTASMNILRAASGGINSLFAGFFADGGKIPAGKFGIAGEAGAEFVTGPATVIPMDKISAGGNTSVTQVNYSINAVDALSFKQMIARDPTFLYAVAEQGRKSLPLTRR